MTEAIGLIATALWGIVFLPLFVLGVLRQVSHLEQRRRMNGAPPRVTPESPSSTEWAIYDVPTYLRITNRRASGTSTR